MKQRGRPSRTGITGSRKVTVSDLRSAAENTRCNAILVGYKDSLRQGGSPIVLAERDQKLGKLGVDSFKPPSNFWDKLNRLPGIRQPLTKDLKLALEKTLPEPGIEYKVVRRQAGLGSLGQERFVAIANWRGGCIAREAKLMVPSACSWLNDE